MMPWDGTERRKEDQFCHEILNRLDRLEEQLHHVVLFIRGNDKPERGALIRLDRLEQAEATRKTHQNLTWAAIVGLAIKSAWEALTRQR